MTNSTYPAGSRALLRGEMTNSAGTIPVSAGYHKWRDVLAALRLAREALGLNKARLDLLEKLMACVPGEVLAADGQGRLVVFASNARLAEMTHRENDKAITRLISELVARGLVMRRQSPNGKRYARRGPDGSQLAYGIDLGPLLARMPEIQALAETQRQQAEICQRLRDDCSLLLSRLATQLRLTEPLHALLEEGRRILRRKPVATMLEALLNRLRQEVSEDVSPQITKEVPASTTEKLRPSAPQNACHKESSQIPKKKTPLELTPELVERLLPRVAGIGRQINGSLDDLLQWLRSALGISPGIWGEGIAKFGYEECALLLMTVYEKQRDFKHPAGFYAAQLRHSGQPGQDLLANLQARARYA
ncbi:MAG: helix-turn-helix domain-containing protein [Mangrovicoccus sp.]